MKKLKIMNKKMNLLKEKIQYKMSLKIKAIRKWKIK